MLTCETCSPSQYTSPCQGLQTTPTVCKNLRIHSTGVTYESVGPTSTDCAEPKTVLNCRPNSRHPEQHLRRSVAYAIYAIFFSSLVFLVYECLTELSQDQKEEVKKTRRALGRREIWQQSATGTDTLPCVVRRLSNYFAT